MKTYRIFRKTMFMMLLTLLLIGLVSPAVAAAGVAIPSPEDYFGSVDETKNTDTHVLRYFKGYSRYPESEMVFYVKQLQEAGLTGAILTDKDNKIARMEYDGNLAATVYWDSAAQHVMVSVPKNVSVAASKGAVGIPEIAAKPAKSVPAGSKATLPDPEDYFGKAARTSDINQGKRYFFENSAYSNWTESVMDAHVAPYLEAMAACGVGEGRIIYNATGDTIVGKTYRTHLNGDQAAEIYWFFGADQISFSVYYEVCEARFTSYEPADTTLETVPAPAPAVKHSIPCDKCNNTGKCQHCGGDTWFEGYKSVTKWGWHDDVWKPDTSTEYVRELCHDDNCFDGSCVACGGDGWLD